MTGRRQDQHRAGQSPFLLAPGSERHGLSVRVTADASTAVLEMAVHGPWSAKLCGQVAAGLRLCLAGPSTSIIIDLHGMTDSYGVSMRFWLTAWQEAALRRSPMHLVLCLPATSALDGRLRSREAAQPLMFATMAEARQATAGRLAGAHRMQARLPPEPGSVRAARDLVTRACQAWELPELLPDARLVVSELAGNAVEHAGTDFVVTVSRDGSRVHVAVRDEVTRFPALAPPAPAGDRGRGLWLIDATATAWGAVPARGGKVVWATVSGT